MSSFALKRDQAMMGAMMKVLMLLGAMCTFGCSAASLVGSVVPPYPTSMGSRYGSCVSAGCAYSFGILEDKNEVPIRLLAQRQVDRVSGITSWQVMDELEYPKLNPEEFLESACYEVGGTKDVVYAIIGKTGTSVTIPAQRWAYRIDQSSGHFVMLNPQNVQCFNTALEAD